MKKKVMILSLSAIAALAAGGILAKKYLKIDVHKIKDAFKNYDEDDGKIIWLDKPYTEKSE